MSVYGLNGADFRKLASQILHRGNGLRFQANGESMQPFIHDSDTIEVAPLDEKSVKPGEVVLLETSDGKLLAHRVINHRRRGGKDMILLKGDACAMPDGWFGRENILGRVVMVEHRGQAIKLRSRNLLLRAWLWVKVAPLAGKLSWLPEPTRTLLRRILLGGLLPE